MNTHTYWLLIEGKRSGPYTVSEIQTRIESGAITGNALCRPSDTNETPWQTVSEFLGQPEPFPACPPLPSKPVERPTPPPLPLGKKPKLWGWIEKVALGCTVIGWFLMGKFIATVQWIKSTYGEDAWGNFFYVWDVIDENPELEEHLWTLIISGPGAILFGLISMALCGVSAWRRRPKIWFALILAIINYLLLNAMP